ncbi:MAG: hypothetical protein Q7T71_13905, partial [Herbiconiux sp.]|nr:hypothetical protein [Herbiconiux sp.]
DLARDLEALVLTVDGVEQVYSRTPALLAVVSSAVATVVGSAPPAPVALSQGPDGLVVEVSVAVSGSRPAAETGRAVFDALMAHLDALPGAPAVGRVAVEVSRVG